MHVVARLLALLATAGCARAATFPDAPIVWRDDDCAPFSPRPEASSSGLGWDAFDQMLRAPLVRLASFEPLVEARNVNAVDEVPSSSWFDATRPWSAGGDGSSLVRDPCEGELEHGLDWFVTAGKPDGGNPGFLACVALTPGARYRAQTGERLPMTRAVLMGITRRASRDRRGLVRAAAGELLPGEPLGHFCYEGVRDDDPNDVVPTNTHASSGRFGSPARGSAASTRARPTRSTPGSPRTLKAMGTSSTTCSVLETRSEAYGSRPPWGAASARARPSISQTCWSTG